MSDAGKGSTTWARVSARLREWIALLLQMVALPCCVG